ncbi:MAG: OmpA family protein [Spirochaetes bacterium]|nr:OmpA family protein [Spirochaetota bacterium]
MKKPALIILLLLHGVASFAAILAWDIPKGERLEITRTAAVKFLVNEKMIKIYQERNIIDLTCSDKTGETSRVKGGFSVYERDSVTDVFHLREQHPSEFDIDRQGRFTVPKRYLMPNLRHLPAFPRKDVAVGETWTEKADLVLTLFSIPFKLTFPVEYSLADIGTRDGAQTAVIKYRFVVDMDLGGGRYPSDFPQKIMGRDEGIINWNVGENRPVSIKEKYRMAFVFKDGNRQMNVNEFQMIIDTTMKMYKPVTKEEKEEARKELKKAAPDGVDVDTDRRGLVIRLGDVLFDFDSARLREDSREKLGRVTELIRKKYPDREIIVEGHTDSTGEKEYNLRLSRDRARSVAEYLRQRGGADKLSYRGFGADRPIAGNGTREERRKNRRVEIIIKLQ